MTSIQSTRVLDFGKRFRALLLHRRLTLLLVLLASLTIRFLLAAFSCGSDIPQFAGFADTFLRHKLCFYEYADASQWSEEGWPYNWMYPYGPLWILILSALRLIVRTPVRCFWAEGTYYVYAPIDWVVAVKSLLIVGDVIVAFLIYKLVLESSGWRRAILSFSLYLLSPITIYISSVYGMFDQLALALALLSMYFYVKGRDVAAGFLGGLSIAFKQTMVFIILPILMDSLLRRSRRPVVMALAALALPFLPFAVACPNSISTIISVLQGFSPSYTIPVAYSFNGISSLATYVHEKTGLCTIPLIKAWFIPFIVLELTSLYYLYRGGNMFCSALFCYTAFTATYWRVNAQYLVPLVALAILCLCIREALGKPFCKKLVLVSALAPSFWPIMFPTSWWFKVHIEHPSQKMIRLVDMFTLKVFDERLYVCYSLFLTALLYAVVLLCCVTRKKFLSQYSMTSVE